MKTIDQSVLEILSTGTVEDSVFRINGGQLDRKLYEGVNQVLANLGGKWNRKLKGHLFESDPTDPLDRVITAGEIGPTNPFEFFETPRLLADRMVERAEIQRGNLILEPSAGKGAIIDAIIGHTKSRGIATCLDYCEINPAYLERLDALTGKAPLATDFLTVDLGSCQRAWHRILMNPPFSKGQDVAHVTHAFNLLAPGGRVVAFMSSGVTFRQERKYQEFRALVEAHGHMEPNPDDSFKSSGTGVNSVMIVMDK